LAFQQTTAGQAPDFPSVPAGDRPSMQLWEQFLNLVSITGRFEPRGISPDRFSLRRIQHARCDMPHSVGDLGCRVFQALHFEDPLVGVGSISPIARTRRSYLYDCRISFSWQWSQVRFQALLPASRKVAPTNATPQYALDR
jgi:hypothetical protein